MKEKLYIIRTKLKDGQIYYLKFLNAAGTFAEYSKNIDEAEKHTKEEMEYLKNAHLPGLGRWVVLHKELERLRNTSAA
jgi:hypothetical protein